MECIVFIMWALIVECSGEFYYQTHINYKEVSQGSGYDVISPNSIVKEIYCNNTNGNANRLYELIVGFTSHSTDYFHFKVVRKSRKISKVVFHTQQPFDEMFTGSNEEWLCKSGIMNKDLLGCNCNIFCLHLYDIRKDDNKFNHASFNFNLTFYDCHSDSVYEHCFQEPQTLTTCRFPTRLIAFDHETNSWNDTPVKSEN